eukprot:scaffold27339_cov28-Tisochrysis_lutea.AAC.4
MRSAAMRSPPRALTPPPAIDVASAPPLPNTSRAAGGGSVVRTTAEVLTSQRFTPYAELRDVAAQRVRRIRVRADVHRLLLLERPLDRAGRAVADTCLAEPGARVGEQHAVHVDASARRRECRRDGGPAARPKRPFGRGELLAA